MCCQAPAFSCVLPRKPAYFQTLPSTSVFPYVLKHKRISIPGQAPAYLHMLLSTSVFPYVAKHQRISICCQAPALCFYVSPVMQNTSILLSCLQALRLPKHQRIFYGLLALCVHAFPPLQYQQNLAGPACLTSVTAFDERPFTSYSVVLFSVASVLFCFVADVLVGLRRLPSFLTRVC